MIELGVEITRGVRYIMVGFCDYGNANEWGKRYDPSYDGSAFAAGVRNGDTIRGIQVSVRCIYFQLKLCI